MTGYRRAPGVAVVEEEDVVYAAILPDGPIVVLDGVAGGDLVEALRRDRARRSPIGWPQLTDAPSTTSAARWSRSSTSCVRRGLLTVRER